MRNKKYDVRQKYDSTADRYDSRYRDIQKQKYFEIFSETEIGKRSIVVDVGGGTGLLLDYLKREDCTTIVTDLSFEMLKEGRKKFPRGYFVCSDSEFLPFKKEIGDIVTCISVIQNLEDPHKTIEECKHILKENKKLILTALEKLFDPENLRKIVEKIGFSIDRIWLLSIEDLALIASKR